ncbi:hypothetical protein TD95_002337 [Thielaviopsis punctulata]|uniref:Mediator of RNA polymerase II transcription subunit 16 n=1 Tax=Thielaviopsis punctulata TaxID=72032 RepID=A0A0F4ZGA5_9PEZI|nr:hypothetical protein TD95_002337 [Thielaviopsis punctulata]
MENEVPNVDMPDVDDLFGDGPAIIQQNDVPMEAAMEISQRPPLPSDLRMRLDQLKIRGCCQMIAWSRAGTVASISPDGMAVELRFLRVDSDTGEWGLSEPSTSELVSGAENIPLIHLAWAPTKTSELAVFDVLGRVTILSFINLNSATYSRKWVSDAFDDLNSVVGCHWLPPMPQTRQNPLYNILNGPAVRQNVNEQFRYENTAVHAFPPYHPHPGRSALICITDNGILKLFYPGPKIEKIEEITHELESVIVSEDQITHASICSDKTGVLAVIATASKQLRVIQIGIDWSPSSLENGHKTFNPKLTEQHVAATTWYQGTNKSGSPVDHAMAKITHLEILASIMDPNAKKWANGVIMSVRSYAPSDPSPYYEPQSVLDRWEIVQEQQPPLQKAFESLGSRTQKINQPAFRLKRLEPVVFDRVIINIHQIQMGRVLFITFADGSVEYRDRFSMELVYTEPNYCKLYGLHEMGLKFENPSPCINVAFSPTGCSMVQICNDKSIKWRKLDFGGDIGDNIKTDAAYSAALAGMTLAAGSYGSFQASFDDILAIARTLRHKPTFCNDFIQEVVRMVKVTVDYSEESHHEALVRNTQLQLVLSIMCYLGFNGQYKQRSFSSKFAKLALHARSVNAMVSISSNTPPHLHDKLAPLDEPEVVDALTGCHKWSIDLIYWLMDSLFELMDDKEFQELLQQKLDYHGFLLKRNNISLNFLLNSSSRGFLVAILRRLQHMETLSKKATSYYERNYMTGEIKVPMPLYRAYSRMHKVIESSIFKFDEFEAFLSGIGADVRASYQRMHGLMIRRQQQQANGNGQVLSAEQISKQIEPMFRAFISKAELGMMISPNIPPMMNGLIKKLMAVDLPALRAKIDYKALFFHDFTLLEIQDSPEALRERQSREVLVDSFKHVILPSAQVLANKKTVPGENYQGGMSGQMPPHIKTAVSTGKIRRCVRCAAVMEDVYGHKPGLTYVLAQMKGCHCGASWGLAPRGRTKL